jgi:L-fucose isomerase-like protein
MEYSSIRLGLAIVASPLEVGADKASILLEELQAILSKTHLELYPYHQPVNSPKDAINAGRMFHDKRVHAICVISASWFEDYLVLDMLEECDVPIIVRGLPGMETGSLCGTQQLGFMLRQLCKSYIVIYDGLNSESALKQVMEYSSASMVRYRLRRSRIGYLGHRVEGMTETTVHELALKKIFGPRVVSIDTSVFLENVSSLIPDAEKWIEIKNQVGKVISKDEDCLESMNVYATLKSVIEEKMLDAVAIGCYPHLMGKVCLSASLLGEEGIPIACEGDVNGALGMMILSWLTSEPVHNTDLLNPIPEDNAIVFSHCGSGGFSLAKSRDEITLAPVRLMDRGLCCLFTAKPGDVTLLNIIPTIDSYKIAVLEGVALETDMVFPGNPLKVQFKSDYRNILSWIIDEGLGHHWMAVYGLHKDEIDDLASMVGCEMICSA